MNNIIFKTTFLKGEDGNNILRIDKTSTSGLVDTYTITLTDGTTTTFNVTNGSSIATIEKTATVGIVDTYTITLTDGSTSTFEVTNGTVPVDDHLDANSTNPVQNKVVTGAINNANNYDNTTSGLTANTKQGAIDELALDLNGFKFYPAGEVDLVASVSDDSYYTDSDGNYILADSPTGEALIDDVTYKALASNEDLRGEKGSDTAMSFGGNIKFEKLSILNSYNGSSVFCDTFEDFNTQPNHSEKSATDATTTDYDLNQYIKVQCYGQMYAYWYKVEFKAKLAGKYLLLGTGNNINTILDVNAGDSLITCRTNNGSTGTYLDFPSIGTNGTNGKALFIQYLG